MKNNNSAAETEPTNVEKLVQTAVDDLLVLNKPKTKPRIVVDEIAPETDNVVELEDKPSLKRSMKSLGTVIKANQKTIVILGATMAVLTIVLKNLNNTANLDDEKVETVEETPTV